MSAAASSDSKPPLRPRAAWWRRAWRVLRRGRGALLPLFAGGAAWGLLAASGVEARPAAHAGGLLAAAGLALSPWRGQAERIVLATLAVVHLGVASTAPRDPFFLALLSAYAVLLCRGLLELERFRLRGAAREVPVPVGWRTQFGLTGAVLAVAFFLFAVVPRPSRPIEILVGEGPPTASGAPRGGAGASSGLDDAPGMEEEISIVLDPAVVAEVRVLDEAGRPIRPRGQLRLRGRCFDEYRDGKWRRTTTDAPRQGQGGTVTLDPVPHEGRTRLAHDVRLFGLRTRTLLVLPDAETIAADRVWTDGRGNLSFDRETEGETRYQVVSWGLPAHPRGIDVAPSEGTAAPLPEGLDFVAQVARTYAGGDPNPWGKAKRIEEFLETEFEYTLSTPSPSPGRDPVVDFLYRGSGYCVHFASAMTLMLRSQGVPARFASGFLVREWEEEGQRFLVRNWDAHAWVEVPFPGIGWVAFDPSPIEGTPAPSAESVGETAAAPPPAAASEGVFDRVQGAFAGFGGEKQARAWGGLLSRVARWWPVAALLVLGLALAAWRRGRGGAAAVPGVAPRRSPGAGFWNEFVRRAGRRGLRPSAATTPFEFAGRVEEAFPGLDARRLVRLYYRVRYGERPLGAEETAAVRDTLDELTSRRSPSVDRRGSR
ncbi:MAG: transglutaminaseTgpA domain-containing protein [Planctomycetota bacterium]